MPDSEGVATSMHRCPRCLHPMAPGEGVPATRLGPFGAGIGTDCNECGFVVPAGSRLLWGSSGRADDPKVATFRRMLPTVLATAASASMVAVIAAFGIGTLVRAGGTGSGAAWAAGLMLIAGAGALGWTVFRRALRPMIADLRGRYAANRSSWIIGDGRFDQWKSDGSSEAMAHRGGPMLGASVRVRTEPAGPSGDVLSISVLGADASTLGVGGSPGSMPAVLSSLQLAHVQLAGDPVPVVVGRAVVMRPQSVRPATIEMRVPAGEPGMEDAVAAARTVAHAALNAEAAPDRPALAGAPDAARRLRRRPLVASARVAATVLGILVAGMLLIWGASNLMTPDGGIWFGVMFMGPMAAIAAVYVLVPGRRGIPGLWARATHETWESGPHGLVSVESAADRRMAVALAIPASTLRAIEPWIAVDDAGGGEAVIQLMAGSREIRRVAVRSERRRAEAAANDLVATATGQPGTTEQR